jgi:hypothetical protein
MDIIGNSKERGDFQARGNTEVSKGVTEETPPLSQIFGTL